MADAVLDREEEDDEEKEAPPPPTFQRLLANDEGENEVASSRCS